MESKELQKVYLVGAGPGEVDLITVKGRKCIESADVLIYDRLANARFIDMTRDDCRVIYVGKNAGNHHVAQEDINRLIVEYAKEGKRVVRLKGGDPYVFGRGAEEAQELIDEGIDFEIVPGVTSPIGGLAYAGIPVTHRDFASSFHVYTGHKMKDSSVDIDFEYAAKAEGTLIFLMGIGSIKIICENLIENGKDADTPLAVVMDATRPTQRIEKSTLGGVCRGELDGRLKTPGIIVVGEVTGLSETLCFLEKKPLFGSKIVVTRSRTQTSMLSDKILELGGECIELSTICIEEIEENTELERAIEELDKYTHIVFSSVNGVDIFFKRLKKMGLDARRLFGVKTCSIGEATAKRLEKHGIINDIMPKTYVSEDLYETLSKSTDENSRVLFIGSKISRGYIQDKLSEKCETKSVAVYDTLVNYAIKDRVISHLKHSEIDYITFTSSSTVRNFVELLGEENKHLLDGIRLISIGNITSRTIEECGLKLYKQSEKSTIDSLVEAMKEDVSNRVEDLDNK